MGAALATSVGGLDVELDRPVWSGLWGEWWRRRRRRLRRAVAVLSVIEHGIR